MRSTLLIVLPCVLGALVLAPAATAQVPLRTISVTGDASILAANDTARVGFGVEARGRTASLALRRSSARLRSVLAALRETGIADRDLRTRRVSVARRRDRRGRKLPGFVSQGGVTAVIRDVSATGAAIDAGVNAGATSVDGPSFFIDDPQALLRQALVAAFGDARSKAAQLAAEAGLTLGAPISIRESSFVPSDTDFGSDSGGGGELQPPALPAPTRPGRSRVFGTVYVVFETR